MYMYILLSQIDSAPRDIELDALLDKPTSGSIINSSSWSVVEAVTMRNRSLLLQQLMHEEVIVRREGNLQAFQRGLDSLQLSDLLVAHPQLMRPLFVAEDGKHLTATEFISLIVTPRSVLSGMQGI